MDILNMQYTCSIPIKVIGNFPIELLYMIMITTYNI